LIESTSWGTGAGGNILIAADDVVIKGQKGGTTTGIATMSQVSGDAGNISIIAESSFSLLDGGSLSADAFDASNAGEISISSPKILLSGNNGLMPSSISSSVLENATGQGGKIRLFNVDSLVMEEGTFISTETLGDSDAGRIEIDAKKISLTGAAILAATHSNGNGGDIEMNAQHVTLSGGGGISCETRGAGDGGKLILNAENLTIEDGAQIASDSFSSGAGGMLDISTTGDLVLSNALITTESKNAEGGDINVNCKNLNLSDQSEILAKSSGNGDAGSVSISVLSDLTIQNSAINTQASQADGGEIAVDAGRLITLKSGKILASVNGGTGTIGGNINLISKDILLDENSQIYANAFEGQGGRITISSNVFLKEPLGILDASSQIGIDGIIEISAPFTNLSGSLKPLPTDFVNAAKLVKTPCDARVKDGDYGSFTVRGRDGLPIEPGGFQISPIVDF
jgi:large exoprotein involved in heme utilization and adhesion